MTESASTKTPARDRPVFTIRLRPEPGVDPIHALRSALKVLLRRFGMRAVSIDERIEEPNNDE